MNRRNYSIALFFILLIGLTSCKPLDSPLSDLILSDPSVLRPEILIKKETNSLGHTSFYGSVKIYDKNGDLVRLKDGVVSVNSVNLPLSGSEGTRGRFYELTSDALRFDSGQVVTVIIQLGDGEKYLSDVKAPDKDLSKMYLPESVSRSSNLVIRWEQISVSNPRTLFLRYYYKKSDGRAHSGEQTVEISNPSTGRYILNSGFFQIEPNIYEMFLRLISSSTGTVDTHFMKGGFINCQLVLTGSVEVQ